MDPELADRFDRQLAWTAQHFEVMQRRTDERFERLIEALNDRFEAIDRRFEAIDRRFEAIDRRFEAIDRRFDHMLAITAGQFETMQKRMDERFDALAIALDIRFTALERRVSRSNGEWPR